jgi:hypothetical protein
MGGEGSGNHHHWWRAPAKHRVEDCTVLDLGEWRQKGLLQTGIRVSGTCTWNDRRNRGLEVGFELDTREPSGYWLGLHYSFIRVRTNLQESADYRVRLVTTRPYFGGLRWWFVCPLQVNGVPCNRRVGKLYLPTSNRHFGCRHCHDLTYTSCQASHLYDGTWRALARDLGWEVDDLKDALEGRGKKWGW